LTAGKYQPGTYAVPARSPRAAADDRSVGSARNHVSQGVPGNPAAARTRQRPGVSRFSRPVEDAPAALGIVSEALPGEAWPDGREDLQLRVQSFGCLRRC